MKTKYDRTNRILAIFMHRKLSRIIKGLSLQELTDYLDEKGWYMYDLERMADNIQKWKKTRKKKCFGDV